MKHVIFSLVILLLFGFYIIKKNDKANDVAFQLKGFINSAINEPNYINQKGNTIATRIKAPKGFERVVYPKNSFKEYLRNYKLKIHGAPIINYDGSSYFAQHWHDAILEIPVPKNGLQQCADALMRIRAEYLWEQNRKEEIGFNFTSGDYCSWKYYAKGFRPKIKGNKVSFHKIALPDNSKASFYKYLNLIFMYAGTASLYAELPKVEIKDLRIGDMLVKPGFPGHIEIIVDAIKNEKGEKMYLLAQGNTPVQNVCLLKNFEDKEISPWYTFVEKETIYTPSYYFDKPVFVRFK